MDKFRILKSLAPGFLPLIVFLIADSIWGTRIGLIVAIVFGILEFIISYIKEKILDKFILLDIGLIVVLGAVSVILENDVFFKLKPAIIELIFSIVLGISVYSPLNIILLISKRYMKNFELNELNLKQLNRSLKILFFLFLVHTLLIIYSALFMSKKAWGFISGGLFYLIFLVFFIVEYFRSKIIKRKWISQYNGEEWFDIVDQQGHILGKAPRRVCHSGPGRLHPVVHVHLIDNRDRIFLQKRSMKKQVQPGKWDTAIGGHVLSGEKIEDALKREAEEELGIKEFSINFIARYIWETEIESELVFLFYTRYNKIPIINSDEIDEGNFWRIKKIRENLGKGIFTPNFEHDFQLLVRNVFKIPEF